MSTYSNVRKLGTLAAGSDLRTKQFTAVRITGSNAVGAATTTAHNIIGILQNKPNTGEAAEIDTEGVTRWKAGDTITAGQKLMVDSAGRCVPLVVASGVRAYGQAVEGGAVNEIIPVLIPGGDDLSS